MGSSGSGGEEVTQAGARPRVSGNTWSSRLSVEEAVNVLGIKANILRERIRDGTIAHEHDEHGRVYLLVGASSNLPDPDHHRRRAPQDEAIIEYLEAQTSNLRAVSEPSAGLGTLPEAPEAPR